MTPEIIRASSRAALRETLTQDVPAFIAMLAFVSIVAAYIGC